MMEEKGQAAFFVSTVAVVALTALFVFSIFSKAEEEELKIEDFGDGSPEDVHRLGIKERRCF